jgi:hypothetical protein
MTPQNLMDYVKVYNNFIPNKLCKKALKSLKKTEWTKHSYARHRNDERYTFDTDLSITYESILEKKEIDQLVWFAIEKYILKDFSSFTQWWSGWNGYTSVRFNRYDPTTEMRLHCDHIHGIFDGSRKGIPILTVLGSLNKDYEGGELMLFQDYHLPLDAGSIVIFPSNFMFPHEVKPVKSGVRYSFVSWTW